MSTKKICSTAYHGSVKKFMDIIHKVEPMDEPCYYFFQTRAGMCGELMVHLWDGYPMYDVSFVFVDANGKPVEENGELYVCPMTISWSTAYAEIYWDSIPEHSLAGMSFNRFKMAINELNIHDYTQVEGLPTYMGLDGHLEYEESSEANHTIKFMGDDSKNWFNLCT